MKIKDGGHNNITAEHEQPVWPTQNTPALQATDLGETIPSDGEYDLKIKLAVESVFSMHLGVFSKLQ